ncbi:MAG: hypothetical protein NT010_12960 [Proteobacteria bacterium]|nr:hypothetical protein [Pseudomonadota bacterium]
MRRTIIIALLLLAIVITVFLIKPYFLYYQPPKDFLVGLLSSSIVVLFIEAISYWRDLRRFSYLRGKFKRVEIYNKIKPDRATKDGKDYEDMTTRYVAEKVCPLIKIRHLGEGRFTGSAHYEEGKVKFDLLLDALNPAHGFGAYQYTVKKPGYPLPDFGKYELFRDKLNDDRVYVYYENIAPTKRAEGYEVWEKT